MCHADRYIHALLADEPVAGDFVDELGQDASFDDAVCSAAITWKQLSEQPDREAATFILGRRIQALLERGDVDAVIDHLREPELARDSLTDPAMEAVVVHALASVAWTEPDTARTLFDRLNADRSDAEMRELYISFEASHAAARMWQSYRTEQDCPAALERFLSLALSASPGTLTRLVEDLRAGVSEDPEQYLATLDTMRMGYPSLFLFSLGLAERFSAEPARGLADMSEQARGALTDSLSRIDGSVGGGDSRPVLLPFLLGAGGLMSLFMANLLGGVGIPLAFALFAAAGYVWVSKDRSSYREAIRPQLARVVADLGTPPGSIVSWLLAHGRSAKRLRSFDVAVEGDYSLDALSRFARMQRRFDSEDDE